MNLVFEGFIIIYFAFALGRYIFFPPPFYSFNVPKGTLEYLIFHLSGISGLSFNLVSEESFDSNFLSSFLFFYMLLFLSCPFCDNGPLITLFTPPHPPVPSPLLDFLVSILMFYF